MNGYKILEQTYKQAAAADPENRESLLKKAGVMEFLSSCDDEDKATLWKSGAFNEAIGRCVDMAAEQLTREEKLTASQAEEIRGRIRELVNGL